MWCIEDPQGKLLEGTIGDTRDDALDNLFGYMLPDFRKKHWKNIRTARSAYTRMGYKAVQVKLVKIK